MPLDIDAVYKQLSGYKTPRSARQLESGQVQQQTLSNFIQIFS